MDRYRALYVWKILKGITPNCGLEINTSERRGREATYSAFEESKFPGEWSQNLQFFAQEDQ